MTGQAVTTNPVMIMLINMTIVFGVLWILGYIIRFLHVIDPTRKKAEAAAAALEAAAQAAAQASAAKAAAEAKAAAAAAVATETSMEDKTLAAVATTAIMASGYKDVKVKSIKKS